MPRSMRKQLINVRAATRRASNHIVMPTMHEIRLLLALISFHARETPGFKTVVNSLLKNCGKCD